nr:fibronectin type-III domain-containing protein 3a-like isoform X3 [Helicoverpa armigera]XP_049706942.1 fibronectin type-III domain-containing protein 3a isoform X3 [Helicoverpa armigera]
MSEGDGNKVNNSQQEGNIKAPTNGTGGPQHYYSTGYPPHFHHVPHHMQHSPPPPAVFQKDERTQRQYSKLKQKLERKQTNRNNGIDANSGASTPSLSPRKEINGRAGSSSGASSGGSGASSGSSLPSSGPSSGASAGCAGSGGTTSSGAWSEEGEASSAEASVQGDGSSAAASVQGDAEPEDETDAQAILDMFAARRTPQITDVSSTSALVIWNLPVPEDVIVPNGELTYDLLLADRGGRYKAIYSGQSLTCRVRDLKPGYEYSVCLQIRAGKLETTSASATFRAPAARPEQMAAPRVTQRARTSLQLRWAAAADNGARLLHYVLEMDDGDGFVEISRPRTRQHTANNLRPQTRYRFRIAAVNDCGRGEWSEETVAWTTGSPPPAPAPPALTSATNDSLVLGWERRSDEEFTLQMDDAARGHGFLPVYSGPDRTYVCTGLHRATDYRFRLRCETVDGQGPWSVEVTYRTLPERPGPPGRPTSRGRIHSRAFRLRWEQPVDDGGAAVDCYTLELDAGDGYRPAYRGPEREAHCDRLLPGTPYRARVRCSNEAGVSDWSAAETVTTEAAAPAAPPAPAPAAEPRSTLVSLRWRPPDCTGGAPLTDYRLEILEAQDPDGAARLAYQGPECECIVRDLMPGRLYHTWVTAHNRVGASPSSPALIFATAPAPPDAPDTPTAQLEGARAARLEWSPPRDNGASILDYRLEMSSTNVDDAFSEVYRGADTSCLVSRLVPFSPYFFRVCASNAAGRGAWSGVRDVLTPRAPPAAPAGLRHEATADSLRLQWRPPAAHGAPLLRYRVEVGDAAYDTEGPAPERVVRGLAPDTVYRVRVAALNELGLGEWSDEARAATRPPPPAPPALRCVQAQHNHLRLEWPAAGGEGATYCVEMRSLDARDFRPVYRGSARSCKVKKLREATTYAFRIRASDERGGRGAWSEPLEAATIAAPPPAPRAPTVTQPAPRSALVSWDPLDDAEYLLQCARARDAAYKQVYSGSETQFQLDELEAGAEYLVRVCGVRGGLAGAWSPAARLAVPAGAPAPRPRRARPARTLHPRQLALLMAAAFLLLAVAVAVLLQGLVEPQP